MITRRYQTEASYQPVQRLHWIHCLVFCYGAVASIGLFTSRNVLAWGFRSTL